MIDGNHDPQDTIIGDRLSAIAACLACQGAYPETDAAMARCSTGLGPPVSNAQENEQCVSVHVCVNSRTARELHMTDAPPRYKRAEDIERIVLAVAADVQATCVASAEPTECRRCGRHCILASVARRCVAAHGLFGLACAHGCCDDCRLLASLRIARWAKRCITDPSLRACRKRLLREFELMSS